MPRRKNIIELHALKQHLDGQSCPSKTKWELYSCELVTPMYGGGVDAGKIDMAMPIRASSIRGQLRFWWRIACGPSNAGDMRVAEQAIWGGIGNDNAVGSQVIIKVGCPKVSGNQLIDSKTMSALGTKYAFGAAEATRCLSSGYKFTLSIRYKEGLSNDMQTQVRLAIRWWASFGGVGARTRRGFGAVEVKLKNTDGHETTLTPIDQAEVEKKDGKLAFKRLANNSAEQAWQNATGALHGFRQGKLGRKYRNHTVKPDTEVAGRSYWPEADQLRHLTGKDDNGRHKPEFVKHLVFPRAVFGMPLQFKFIGKAEPTISKLLPKNAQRMASPLILRPYKQGAKWYAAALLLPYWQDALEESVELSINRKTIAVHHWPTSEQDRNKIANDILPMKGRANDPLNAFLDFFVEGN